MTGSLSPDTVSAVAWSCVGLYVLGLIGWEWRKTVRHARRERALTEQVRQETERIRQREQQLTEEARRAATDD